MVDRWALDPDVAGSNPATPAMRQEHLLNDGPELKLFVHRALKLHEDGLTWAQIAQQLGVSPACVRYRIAKVQERGVAQPG